MRDRQIDSSKAYDREVKALDDAETKSNLDAMSMKEILLKGIKYRELFEIHPEYDVEIRPITDLEYTYVRKKMLEGISRGDVKDPDRDLGSIMDNNRDSKYLAVSYALNCNGVSWTPEEVGQLPPRVPELIYQRVARISGFTRGEGIPTK